MSVTTLSAPIRDNTETLKKFHGLPTIISILQMKKLGLKGVKIPFQGLTASKRWVCLISNMRLSTTVLYAFPGLADLCGGDMSTTKKNLLDSSGSHFLHFPNRADCFCSPC